jgi:hypothetical protein
MVDPLIRESQFVCTPLNRCRRLPVWPGRNRGLGEMTTDYQADAQAYHGKKLFAISVLFFSQGLTWFGLDLPGGIFTLRPLNTFDAFFRAEIVIGAIVAAYGMLVWRSASRKLSVANYIIVFSCVTVLLPCVSKQSEWVYVLNHHRGFLTLNDLKILVIEITVPVCILVLGAWWADSTFVREQFYRFICSSRFVK